MSVYYQQCITHICHHRGMTPQPPSNSALSSVPSAFGTLLGFQILELTPGRAVVSMPVENHTQPAGLLHGGAILALCEETASLAANQHALELGGVAAGSSVSVSHVASANSGTVFCEASAEHLGGTTTLHRVFVRDESGRLLSTGQVTNHILLRRKH